MRFPGSGFGEAEGGADELHPARNVNMSEVQNIKRIMAGPRT
jgi:hypothetical protein